MAHLTNFSFEFFYKIFTEDASRSLLYHGAKKSKMTKNSNQGGPALNDLRAGGSRSGMYLFDSCTNNLEYKFHKTAAKLRLIFKRFELQLWKRCGQSRKTKEPCSSRIVDKVGMPRGGGGEGRGGEWGGVLRSFFLFFFGRFIYDSNTQRKQKDKRRF